MDNPALALGELQEVRTELAVQNAIHEFLEDIFELTDGNPNNNSFTDGGNGSGNETPTSQFFWPPGSEPGNGGGIPVVLTVNGSGYSGTFFGGDFFYVTFDNPLGGGGGGGGDPI